MIIHEMEFLSIISKLKESLTFVQNKRATLSTKFGEI